MVRPVRVVAGGLEVLPVGESGFAPCQGDLPRPEQHPVIRSREDEAPIAEQIEEIATLPFHRVQHLSPVAFLIMWDFKNEPLGYYEKTLASNGS